MGNWVKIVVLIVICLIPLFIFPAFADEDTIISIIIIGESEFYLDSDNKMIRAKVVIENFDPAGDGYYFMRVSDSSGNVIKDTEILPKYKGNEIWGTEIAHIITNEVPETFQILIYTEFGTATATVTISLLETKPPSSAFAQIETISEYGSVRIDSEIYEIKSGEKINVKISGNINDVLGGAKITLVITEPNELTTGLQLTPTNKGYFETLWTLDDNSLRGQYEVLATYHTYTIGSVFFSLEDKVFSEEELLEARGISEEEQIEEAEPTITVTENDKELIESYLDKAENYYENENHEAAIPFYERILEIDEQNLDALNRLGLSYLYLNDVNKALPYFEKAISIDPNFHKAYYNIGLVYEAKGQINTALPYFDKAIEKADNPHEFRVGKASALYFSGRYTDSIKELDIVLKDEPNNLDALDVKALALSSRDGKYDQFDALLAFNKILEIDPDYPDAAHNKKYTLNLIGGDYMSKYDYEEAISYFDKILEMDSNYFDAVYNKGLSLQELGNDKEALTYFDRALEIKPGYYDVKKSKELSLEKMDKTTSTISTLNVQSKITTWLPIIIPIIIVGVVSAVAAKKIAKRKAEPIEHRKPEREAKEQKDESKWEGI